MQHLDALWIDHADKSLACGFLEHCLRSCLRLLSCSPVENVSPLPRFIFEQLSIDIARLLFQEYVLNVFSFAQEILVGHVFDKFELSNFYDNLRHWYYPITGSLIAPRSVSGVSAPRRAGGRAAFSTRTAQTLKSGILARLSSRGSVSTLAAASAK
jgi:hypothetical protein